MPSAKQKAADISKLQYREKGEETAEAILRIKIVDICDVRVCRSCWTDFGCGRPRSHSKIVPFFAASQIYNRLLLAVGRYPMYILDSAMITRSDVRERLDYKSCIEKMHSVPIRFAPNCFCTRTKLTYVVNMVQNLQ